MYVFEDLMKVLKDSNRPYDFDKITEAYRYAEKAHDGQMRQSGEPYITHPIAVAQILVELGMDTETICAGLLHDVVEDTSSTIEEIKKIFGADVALMVDGVTKLTKLSYSSKEQRQAENVRKMLLAMAKDVRVIIVKLSDRLHNMRTLGSMLPAKQFKIAGETHLSLCTFGSTPGSLHHQNGTGGPEF